MAIIENPRAAEASRRELLRRAALLAAGGAAFGAGLAVSSEAQAKVSQKAAQYQSMPKGSQRCDNCLQWQAPASCKVVAGSIDPAAWCTLYGPKPKS